MNSEDVTENITCSTNEHVKSRNLLFFKNVVRLIRLLLSRSNCQKQNVIRL